MDQDPCIDRETAQDAERALLTAITDLLEAALDQCAGADAASQIPHIADLCRDVVALADVHGMIRRRSRP